ncbi:GspH/FimT family pseudopilin [Pseudoalteromonas fenneropenaei]|uniref:Type II secretion system protein H n=1 Tax=Pseudoalteromonas fenneropenaei TaxID=1737459 RepID=A0ABV7CLW5_9GAMM
MKQRGFTLMELMIGVAIVAILAVIAMPSFVQQIKQDRIVTQANQVQALYRFARSEAVKRDTSLQLKVVDGSWCVVESIAGKDVELRRFSLEHSSLSINLSAVSFDSSGGVSAPSNILITDNDTSTTDYRFCSLISGQSWLVAGAATC